MGFVLYRSSAGSGKTYTLVKEYLKIVLQNPERFKNILAVTFTNKAAGEMKDRIVLALQNLSAGNDPELAAALSRELGSRAPADIKTSSAAILSRVLHHYSDFAIMTIDSFIHRVIKAFALEIGLPLNFGITLNTEGMETYVIEKLLAEVGRDEFITDVFLKFVFDRIQAEKSWNIEGEIKRFEKEILNDKNIDWVQGLSAIDNIEYYRLIEELDNLGGGFAAALNDAASRGLRLIEEAGLTVDDFAYKKAGAAGFLQKCRDLKMGGLKGFFMSKRFSEGVWYGKSQDAGTQAAIEGLLRDGLEAAAEEIVSLYDSQRAQALTALFAADNIYLTAIISRIKAQVDEYKEKNNLIPISEFNVRVYDIIKKAPIPFLYSILGEKYNHYLIDEFQDTSRLQFENLLPLFQNALSEGFFSMAVGDGKQSIYRWRGGDVEIMEQDLQDRLPPGQLEIERLGKNYRSSRQVVEFNNRFFEKVGDFYKQDNILLGHIYADTVQEAVRKEGGYVSLRFVETDEASPAGTGEADVGGAVFNQVIRIIRGCRERGYDFNDAAVLVRENKEGREIAERLLQEEIPVVSPDSLVLPEVPLVRFLIDVLTYLSDPDDKIAEAAIIYFILLNRPGKEINKSFDQTFSKAPRHGEPTKGSPASRSRPGNTDTDFSTMGPPEVISAAFLHRTHRELTPELEEFFKRRSFLIRLPVYEVIEETIRIFNLQESLDFAAAGYLQAFLNIAAGYSTENSIDLSSFLDWWELNKNDYSMIVPESKPAVRIMSIHKAKGLEFPVVIIPYANWPHNVDKQLWLTPDPPLPTSLPEGTAMLVNRHKALEESHFCRDLQVEQEKVLIDNINLLYVAFTRAEDELYVFAQPKRGGKNDNYDRLKELAVPLLREGEQPGVYVSGEPGRKQQVDQKKKSPAVEYRESGRLISNKWYGKISIRRRSVDSWAVDERRAGKRDWGLLVHRVLSQLRSEEDVGRVVEQAVFSGDIALEEKETLRKEIAGIFADKEAASWFAPGLTVFVEAPIITGQGILRPDRVIVSEGKAAVIDFKTGVESAAHEKQVIKYSEALRTIGYEKVEAFVFYLETKKIKKVVEKNHEL